jgi:hypothetical protein
MALLTPTLLDTKSYDFSVVRNIWTSQIVQSGIIDKGHFAITPKASQPPLAITVAAGEAWVKATAGTRNGAYHVVNDAAVDINLTAADATNPRIDRVVVRINDSSDLASSTDIPDLYVITGTPSAGATLANLTGAGAAPANSLTLGFVRVTAGMTSTTSGNIGGWGEPYNNPGAGAVAGAPPAYAFGRPSSFIPACEVTRSADLSVANATATVVPYTAENLDNDGCHDNSTNNSRITIQTPGTYTVTAQSQFALNSGGGRQSSIRVAELFTIASSLNNGNAGIATNSSVSWTGRIGYGGIFDHQVYQNSGGALNLSYIAFAMPYFRAQWIAP